VLGPITLDIGIGSAYEHFQNDALDARSYFNDPTQPVPPLKFNQFGGSIGGPFLRNKMFFFFNYDKTIDNSSYTEFVSMPTDALKGANTPNGQFDLTQLMPLDGNGNKMPVTDGNGNNILNPCTNTAVYQGEIFDPATQTTVNGEMCRFPFATDNVIPAARVDSVARNLLKYFPQPNQNTSLGINGDYYSVIPTPYPATRIFGRIDYQFNDKNRLPPPSPSATRTPPSTTNGTARWRVTTMTPPTTRARPPTFGLSAARS
jgi:hypothetical protein